MTQRNPAGQDVRVGEVFVEDTEKMGVRDFGLCAQRDSPVLEGRRRLPQEVRGLLDQRTAGWVILNRIWKSKMEMRVQDSRLIGLVIDGTTAGHSARAVVGCAARSAMPKEK